MSFDLRRSFAWIKQNPAIVLLVATYVYIFFGILTWQNAWVEPEMLEMTGNFLDKKLTFMSPAWWVEGFDYPLWEYAPRIYRPLSSYFQMFDANFRQWLWHYTVPHPSLSLTWIFTLVLSPLLLFLLLRRLKVSVNSSLLAASLYIANTGVLSVVTMYFRPAKPMTNYSILLCLWLASVLSDAQGKARSRMSSFGAYILLLAVMLFSFFWDETAIVIYPAVLFIFPQLVTKSRKHLGAFVALGIVAISFYTVILHWVTTLAGFPPADLMSYRATKGSFDLKSAIQEHIGLPADALQNLKIEFMDCMGLTDPNLLTSTAGVILQYATWSAVILFVGICLDKFVFRRIFSWTELRVAALLLCSSIFNTYTISTIGNNVWGLYYYGIYITVFFVLFIGLILRDLEENLKFKKYWFCALATLIVASSLYIFPNTVYVYKHAHYYRPDGGGIQLLKSTFLNDENRFELREHSAIPQLYEHTREYWNCTKAKPNCPKPPIRELTYLYVELYHF